MSISCFKKWLRLWKQRSVGFSTLEFALAMPIVIGFVLGAVGVGKYFQVYSVLQQGTRLALRCFTAVDDACQKKVLNAAPLPNEYDWYRRTVNVKYPIDKYRYEGDVEWLEPPIYRYTPKAQILKSVRSEYEQIPYVGERWEIGVYGRIFFKLQTDVQPFLTGQNGRDVVFRKRNDTGDGYATPLTWNLNLEAQRHTAYHIRVPDPGPEHRTGLVQYGFGTLEVKEGNHTIAREGVPFGVVSLNHGDTLHPNSPETFIIPRPASYPKPNENCFQSTKIDGLDGYHSPDYNNKCDTALDRNKTEAVVLISGQSSGQGKVEISLTWDGGSLDLGGRSYEGSGWGWFVPRGAKPGYIDPDLVEAQYINGVKASSGDCTDPQRKCYPYTELEKYSSGENQVILPFDKPITVKAKVWLTGGASTEWRGTTIKIYLPQFISGMDFRDCETAISRPKYKEFEDYYYGQDLPWEDAFMRWEGSQKAKETCVFPKIPDGQDIPDGQKFYPADKLAPPEQRFLFNRLSLGKSGETSPNFRDLKCHTTVESAKKMLKEDIKDDADVNEFWIVKPSSEAPRKSSILNCASLTYPNPGPNGGQGTGDLCPQYGQIAKNSDNLIPNFGVPGGPNDGSFLTKSHPSRKSAERICPPPIPQDVVEHNLHSSEKIDPANIRWDEHIVPITTPEGSFSFDIVKRTCQQNDVKIPDSLKVVPEDKLHLGAAEYVGSSSAVENRIYTGSVKPQDMLTFDPRYSCGDFSTGTMHIGENFQPPLPYTSLFVGEHDDLGELCWEKKLKEDGIKQGIYPADAYFKGVDTKIRTIYQDMPPSGECHVGVYTSEFTEGDEELITTNGPLPEGQKPAVCNDPDVTCRAELVNIGGNGKDILTQNNEAEFVERFLGEVKAAYPNAKYCEGDGPFGPEQVDCVRVKHDMVEEKGRLVHQVTAQGRVSMGFGLSFPLTVQKSGEGEVNFLR